MFPPVGEWGIDPLYISYRKTFCWLLHNCVYYVHQDKLIEIYYFGRPISKVEVVGVVVNIVRTSKRATVYIDDGTGTIPSIKFLNANDTESGTFMFGLAIGQLVTIRGKLIYLETNADPYSLHLQLDSIDPLHEPNLELLHWTSALHLHQSTYCEPYRKAAGLSTSPHNPASTRTQCACITASSLLYRHMRSSQLSVQTQSKETTITASSTTSAATASSVFDRNLANLRRACSCDPQHAVRTSLLYCPCVASHSIATSEKASIQAHDPHCTFRLQVLLLLLQLLDSQSRSLPPGASSHPRPPLMIRYSVLRAQHAVQECALNYFSSAVDGGAAVLGVFKPYTGSNLTALQTEPADSTKKSRFGHDSSGDTVSSVLGSLPVDFYDRLLQETFVALIDDGIILSKPATESASDQVRVYGSMKDCELLLVTIDEVLVPTLEHFLKTFHSSDAAEARVSTELPQVVQHRLKQAYPSICAWRWEIAAAYLDCAGGVS